jgi:type VI secretion system protein
MEHLKKGLMFCLCALLTACGSSPEMNNIALLRVSLYATKDANNNSATPVDLIVVYDPTLSKALSGLTAAQYFETANQLRQDNPTHVDIWRFEIVPGQLIKRFELKNLGSYGDAYVFANYLAPGPHRLKIAVDYNDAYILLTDKDVQNNYDDDFKKTLPKEEQPGPKPIRMGTVSGEIQLPKPSLKPITGEVIHDTRMPPVDVNGQPIDPDPATQPAPVVLPAPTPVPLYPTIPPANMPIPQGPSCLK